MTQSGTYSIEIFPLDAIRPTEEYSAEHADTLRSEISLSGFWTHPLLIDDHKSALMDGHHRYHSARRLGLVAVPVIRLSYDDPLVSLRSWRPDREFLPEDIWALCDSGGLLPMKSTRHVISAPLPFCRVSLDTLRDAESIGQAVAPARPYPPRAEILAEDYHKFGRQAGIRTVSAVRLSSESVSSLVPHAHLRLTLESDPAMAALLPSSPCRIAMGAQGKFPFQLKNTDLLLVAPSLLSSVEALAAVTRWGMEAAFVRQVGRVGYRRLSALLRHGAALIRALSPQARSLVFESLPSQIARELARGHLSPPSERLQSWLLQRIGMAVDLARLQDRDDGHQPGLELLEGPVEQVLTSNGDSRLVVDPATGKNKYGTTPGPRPQAVHFSSSTASSISDYGFLFCDILRRDALNHLLDEDTDAAGLRATLADVVVSELREICALNDADADGVLAPSGTDTEVLAVLLCRAGAPEQRLVNILISPEETGRGVRLAGAGLYFDPISATGAPIGKGTKIWPDAEIDLIEIGIRDAQGHRRDIAELDAAFLDAGRAALAGGGRVLAHMLIGSKTGLRAPSEEAVAQLASEAPDRVDVVVDACQMRVDPASLGAMVRRGWMVQISGSKALTGPPFSGALLLPLHLRDRVAQVGTLMRPGIGYAEDWSAFWAPRLGRSQTPPAFGAIFRWLPALLEVKLQRDVPGTLRSHITDRFRGEITSRFAESRYFKALPQQEADTGTKDAFACHSIITFELLARHWDGALRPLDEAACRAVFEILNSDARPLLPNAGHAEAAILRQEFHIGQPVALGSESRQHAVLRLVLGVRFFNIVAHAGPGGITAALESEISDLMRAIDKLEILAENWWFYNHDI